MSERNETMNEPVGRRDLFKRWAVLGGALALAPAAKLLPEKPTTRDLVLHGGLHLHGDHQAIVNTNVTVRPEQDGNAAAIYVHGKDRA